MSRRTPWVDPHSSYGVRNVLGVVAMYSCKPSLVGTPGVAKRGSDGQDDQNTRGVE